MKSVLHSCVNSKRKSCNKKIIAILYMLSLSGFIYCQTSPAWVQFAGPANYENYDVKEVCVGVDSMGNVYTAASANDTINSLYKTVLVKYNSAGVQQWMKFYNNANTGSDDKQVVALLVDKAGNSYLCGYGFVSTANSSIDYLVQKYDNAGNQQWVKTWDGGQHAWDFITCAAFDAAGNIVVAGYANDNGGTTGDDIGVVKYSTSGTQIWSYVYNNSATNDEDRALAVASDGNNNIFITGSTTGPTDLDMISLKLNSSGVNQWTKQIAHVTTGTDERGYSVAADAAGNSYVTGAAGNWITIKYDPSGTVLWTNHYTTYVLNAYNLKKVMLDKNNNVILAGDADVLSTSHYDDLIVSKLANATGIPLWSINFNNPGVDAFMDAVLDTSGNVYVGGTFEGPLATDMSALCVSSAGNVLWNSTYSNPNYAAGNDNPYHVAVDINKNMVMAGLSERRGSGSADAVDIVTLRYNALVTGIKENTLKDISMSVYPNPAKENLTVSFTEQSLIGSTLFLSNMIGETVKEETLNTLTQQISLGSLSKGIYIIKIINEKSIATGKIIIE